MGDALTQRFGVPFQDNGNSFDTCFQFVAQQSIRDLFVRVKVYNKKLETIQSESVRKPISLNLKGLYYPPLHMERAFKETVQ